MRRFLLIAFAFCAGTLVYAQELAPSPGSSSPSAASNSPPAAVADVEALRQQVQSLTEMVKSLQQQVKDQQAAMEKINQTALLLPEKSEQQPAAASASASPAA